MLGALKRRVVKGFSSGFSPQKKGVGLLVVAILIWGGNWPVVKTGLAHIDPFWFATVRFVLGMTCLFALQIATKNLKVPASRDLPLLISVGLLQMLAFTLLVNYALLTADAGHSAVLAYTTSVWVVPAAHLFFGERISKSQCIGALLGLIGVVAMLNPLDWQAQGRNMLYANLMLIGAAICWAICILHLRYSRAVSSAYHLAPWQMLVALVPLLIFSYVFVGPYTGDGSAQLWLVLLYTGPFGDRILLLRRDSGQSMDEQCHDFYRHAGRTCGGLAYVHRCTGRTSYFAAGFGRHCDFGGHFADLPSEEICSWLNGLKPRPAPTA